MLSQARTELMQASKKSQSPRERVRHRIDPTLATSGEDIEDAYHRIIADDEQVILNESYLEMMPTSRNFTLLDFSTLSCTRMSSNLTLVLYVMVALSLVLKRVQEMKMTGTLSPLSICVITGDYFSLWLSSFVLI
jgi:hypothetical protein